jgi:hypothetical protein
MSFSLIQTAWRWRIFDSQRIFGSKRQTILVGFLEHARSHKCRRDQCRSCCSNGHRMSARLISSCHADCIELFQTGFKLLSVLRKNQSSFNFILKIWLGQEVIFLCFIIYFQEADKLRDDDLYKFLQDLKRPSPVLKRLKCIRGTLKLDISVAPEQTKHCYTPELAKLIPFPGFFKSLWNLSAIL